MRSWWALLLVAVFLFAFYAIPERQEQKCVTVNALGFDGHQGILIPVRFCSTRGSGDVYFKADRIYGADMQKAMLTAKAVFESRYGRQSLDYFVSFDAPPEYFDGRSAALAFYVGFISSTFGADPSAFAFTGDLSPDGSVLPVAYVREKAAAAGSLRVVVPQSNCINDVLCVSSVSEVEDLLSSKRV